MFKVPKTKRDKPAITTSPERGQSENSRLLKWINQRSGMGDVSRVTQAASSVDGNEDISLMRIKRQLEGISWIPEMTPFA
jgi:hypothetical protein